MQKNGANECSSNNNQSSATEDTDASERNRDMLAYQKMYDIAFNAITDAMIALQEIQDDLCRKQQDCEIIFMDSGAPPLRLIK